MDFTAPNPWVVAVHTGNSTMRAVIYREGSLCCWSLRTDHYRYAPHEDTHNRKHIYDSTVVREGFGGSVRSEVSGDVVAF
jgi:hypothetical protein